MDAATFFGLAYLAGVFVSWAVYMRRSGLTDIKHEQGVTWRGFLLPNLLFFILTWVKSIYWPPTLLVWMILYALGLSRCPWKAATSFQGRPVRKIFRIGYRRAIPELGIPEAGDEPA
ncbi:hypothetical protein [Amycolatopsis rifamycinica]|uniref:hypothetical protein n=1 Tax=Amycolatopsis rifamycinica TaxID=287986 RepID=UPI001269E48E|nr:hypothetical protein [Amycolatopsis rifamycinica]